MNLKKIKRVIISVSDKSNLKIILPTLKKFKIEIISVLKYQSTQDFLKCLMVELKLYIQKFMQEFLT